MPDLYPSFTPPAIAETPSSAPQPDYKPSYAFDFETGDFVLDGGGRVPQLDGYQAWVQWCVKAAQTQRLAHLIYSPSYGTDLAEAVSHKDRKAVEADLERAITESLLADPRTGALSDFSFDWSGDGLAVSFTAIPTQGTSARVEVTLSGN